jgi:2-polyprenyl-3-methyl-5-hydroxy-6-metoxy-1,4-benzoquinol methylase
MAFEKTKEVSMTADNPQATKEQLHLYWRYPDKCNRPKAYLEGKERSLFLCEIMKRHVKQGDRILELGCNIGRNLNYLYVAGFHNLTGVEINRKAVRLMSHAYPEMSSHTTIYNSSIERVIPRLDDGAFDVIFTMAVLQHIPPESDWILCEMVRIAKNCIITIEDEHGVSNRHFPRNYRSIFNDSLNMVQVSEANCRDVEGLGEDFVARVFQREYPKVR